MNQIKSNQLQAIENIKAKQQQRKSDKVERMSQENDKNSIALMASRVSKAI